MNAIQILPKKIINLTKKRKVSLSLNSSQSLLNIDVFFKNKEGRSEKFSEEEIEFQRRLFEKYAIEKKRIDEESIEIQNKLKLEEECKQDKSKNKKDQIRKNTQPSKLLHNLRSLIKLSISFRLSL